MSPTLHSGSEATKIAFARARESDYFERSVRCAYSHGNRGRSPVSNYRHVDVANVPNVGEAFGMDADSYEMRFLREALGCENFGVSVMRIAEGFRQPFGHRHDHAEEVYLVVSGRARLKLDDEILDLTPWKAVRVAPQTLRAVEGGDGGR